MILVCVCVCVFIKLHITAQSGPVIYSFYATACNPPGGYLIVDIFLARNARTHSYNSSLHYDGSRPEPHPLDINYNALLDILAGFLRLASFVVGSANIRVRVYCSC